MKFDFDAKPGDYHYSEDRYGKSASGIVKVGAESKRDPALQRSAGGNQRKAHDHGGHLIAHSLGGRNDGSNLDAQDADVNQRSQRGVERQVAKLAQDGEHTVYMEVNNYRQEGNQRPDATMITVAVRDDATGRVDVEHYSFQNASSAEQEEWAAIADEVVERDPRQDIGMTPEERALADELSTAENYDRGELGSGYTAFYDGGTLEEAESAAQTVSASAYDGGTLDMDAAPAESAQTAQYDGGMLDMDTASTAQASAEAGQTVQYDSGYSM